MTRPSFTGPELCGLSACAVIDMLRKKEIAPAELIDAAMERHDAVDGAVNAMPTTCPDRAKASIDEATGRNAYSGPGALYGLPIAIKDLTPVKDVRTTNATFGLKDHVPTFSAPLVERLEARGGLVIGKTNTPEMGAGGNTFNDVFGPTHNPWKLDRNAGGSSGGAAAALATGQVWLAHGSDLAGSLRTPAAYCGIVGLRPSPGRAGGGPAQLAFTMEGISGPMARNVEDCALFLDAMTGFDPREPLSLEPPLTPFRDAVRQAEPPARIAFAPDLGGFAPVEPEIRSMLAAALAQLGDTEIEEACPDLTGLYEANITLRGFLKAGTDGKMPADIRRHFKKTVVENIAVGEALTSAQIVDAQLQRTVLYHTMRQFLTHYDVLACPVVGLAAGPLEDEYPRVVDGQPMVDYLDWLRFSHLATTVGLPALSLPIGVTAGGTPMGIQLIGPPRGEAKLLATAKVLEDAIGFGSTPIDPVA